MYVKGNMLVDFVAFEWNLENQIVVDTMAQREREKEIERESKIIINIRIGLGILE